METIPYLFSALSMLYLICSIEHCKLYLGVCEAMNITRNEIMQNTLKAFRFERPDFIPVTLGISEACWNYYPYDELWAIINEFRPMFTWLDDNVAYGYMPEFLPIQRREPYTDSFGCVWQSGVEGYNGTVTGHPLESWDAFATWKRPDPNVCVTVGFLRTGRLL